MTILQAIIYGIVQGIGEFLPISSSAHLIILPWLFGWQDRGLDFDVALHMGTLTAVVVFFWKDWIRLIRAGFSKPKTQDGRLFWYLVIATIPGAAAGAFFENMAESSFRNPLLIGIMLIIMGFVLYFTDKKGAKKDNLENIGFMRSFTIGLSQALSIVPGVSRSGITMSAGLALGLRRESVAKFTFLLSTPIIAGAGLANFKGLIHSHIDIPFVIGVFTSAVVGIISIKFLLKYLRTKSFGVFTVYRLIAGVLLIIVYFIRNTAP